MDNKKDEALEDVYGQWVDVEEKLPYADSDTSYECWDSKAELTRTIYSRDVRGKSKDQLLAFFGQSNITHWRRIVSPKKQKENADALEQTNKELVLLIKRLIRVIRKNDSRENQTVDATIHYLKRKGFWTIEVLRNDI